MLSVTRYHVDFIIKNVAERYNSINFSFHHSMDGYTLDVRDYLAESIAGEFSLHLSQQPWFRYGEDGNDTAWDEEHIVFSDEGYEYGFPIFIGLSGHGSDNISKNPKYDNQEKIFPYSHLAEMIVVLYNPTTTLGKKKMKNNSVGEVYWININPTVLKTEKQKAFIESELALAYSQIQQKYSALLDFLPNV